MSINYYMACPECKELAIIFRFTLSGHNPPNGRKVQDFWLKHHDHKGFQPICHEQADLIDDAFETEWAEFDTYDSQPVDK